MPAIMLYVRAPQPIVLPLSAQRAVQGMLYSLLKSDAALARHTHDEGSAFEGHSYKFITFSRLRARHRLEGRKAVYEGGGRIEIRTPDARLANAFLRALRETDRVELHRQRLDVTDIGFADPRIEQTHVRVKMITPLTVHVQGENGFIRFFAPDEPDFAQLVSVNCRRKASAFFGREITAPISIVPECVQARDKCVTSFKGTSICGYYGCYDLSGDPEVLTFLYYTGLGARNSQGFGMFDVISEG